MANSWFQFKQFKIHQDKCAMKVTTDACLFGGWLVERVGSPSAAEGLAKARRESGVLRPPKACRRRAGSRVLDIGTGTGLLSLMLAQKMEVIAEALEIDGDACIQAKENIEASPWAEQIKIIHADARNFESSHLYDMVISNPPFYENEWKSDDPKKNSAHHSNDLLLEEVLILIKKTLKPGGSFFLLLPFKRHTEVKEMMIAHQLHVEQVTLVRQTVNHDYFRIMIAGLLNPAETTETLIDEIAIKNNNDEYTYEFTRLLKDYYLHL